MLPATKTQPYIPATGFFGNCFVEHKGDGTTTAAIGDVESYSFTAGHFAATDIVMLFAEVQAPAGTVGDINIVIDGAGIQGVNAQTITNVQATISSDMLNSNNKLKYQGRLMFGAAAETIYNAQVANGAGMAGAFTLTLQAGRSGGVGTVYWRWIIYSIRS
jgi:hypothetical protein